MKDAKTVMQSRAAKSAYEAGGIGRPEESVAPKRRVNWLSLYRHRERLAALVAENLARPVVVLDAGSLRRVAEVVSRVLAVR